MTSRVDGDRGRVMYRGWERKRERFRRVMRGGRRGGKDGDGTKEEGRGGNEKCRAGMNVCV